MSDSIFTARLQLLALKLHQLELALQNVGALEKSLDVPVMRSFLTDRVRRALIDWAFTHPFCNAVTATEVENPASQRLFETLGAELVSATDHSTTWELRKYSVQPEK